MRVTAKRNSESGEYHASDELRFLLMAVVHDEDGAILAPMQAPVVPMPEPGEPKRAFVGAAMANVVKAVSMVAVDELWACSPTSRPTSTPSRSSSPS